MLTNLRGHSNHEIFECAHLHFTLSSWSKQTSIDIYTRAQCSHASVGLAQAHPNDQPLRLLPVVIECIWFRQEHVSTMIK